MEKFQTSVKTLNNLWRFIEIYAVFVLNLRGENSVWRKSLWRKNYKYEVWVIQVIEVIQVVQVVLVVILDDIWFSGFKPSNY